MSERIHQFGDLHGGVARTAPDAPVRRKRSAPGEPPRVGVIYNPRSHRNKGQDLVAANLPNVTVRLPHGRERIAETLLQFARDGIDYLVINGGDGTVRDVLSAGQTVFGDDWPEIAVLPKGKTNALNVDLGAPAGWSLSEAVDAFATGKRIERRPLEISGLADGSGSVRGFFFGAGAFTIAVKAGQDAHRLGAFDSLAVGVTALWGMLQTFFGSDRNAWRRGVAMDMRLLPDGRPMPRSPFGEPGRRAILLASTLQRLPMGIKLFDGLDGALKIAILDHPRRRIMAVLPAVIAGYLPDWLEKAGLHRCAVEAFEVDLEDQFILDGEAFPPGHYRVGQGAPLTFVVP